MTNIELRLMERCLNLIANEITNDSADSTIEIPVHDIEKWKGNFFKNYIDTVSEMHYNSN